MDIMLFFYIYDSVHINIYMHTNMNLLLGSGVIFGRFGADGAAHLPPFRVNLRHP